MDRRERVVTEEYDMNARKWARSIGFMATVYI